MKETEQTTELAKPRKMLTLRKHQIASMTEEDLERSVSMMPNPRPPDSYSECLSMCIPCIE
jgi:hypothetical protein